MTTHYCERCWRGSGQCRCGDDSYHVRAGVGGDRLLAEIDRLRARVAQLASEVEKASTVNLRVCEQLDKAERERDAALAAAAEWEKDFGVLAWERDAARACVAEFANSVPVARVREVLENDFGVPPDQVEKVLGIPLDQVGEGGGDAV